MFDRTNRSPLFSPVCSGAAAGRTPTGSWSVLAGGLLLGCALLISGCDLIGSETSTPDAKIVEEVTDFEEGVAGWTGDFADYPTSKSEEDMSLVFDRRPLPGEVDASGHGLYLSGRNLSDDLFMFLEREVSGLVPNTWYQVHAEADLASNAPSDCAGIGGPPGEAVYLKVGASAVEPEPVVEDGDYRMNVDKGNQSTGGEHTDVIGNVANGVNECSDTPYRMITRSTEEPLVLETDSSGSLWVFIGTDSGFEGTTSLYYHRISVRVEPVPVGEE